MAGLYLTLRGTPIMYYGEEIGMENNDPKRKEDVKDPIGKIGWPKEKGRDGERTPMQWDTSKNAGFSKADHTWLPIPPSYKERNVEVENKNPDSLLNWYKQLLALRKANTAIRDGSYVTVNPEEPNVLSFVRKDVNGNAVL